MNNEPQTPARPDVLTLTELRVLSGLSRGAAMPLDDSVTIGSDFACDLILVDPGVEEKHATLRRDAEGKLSLQTTKASAAAGSKAGARREVVSGQPFEVAGIHMVVCESDAPWDFSLPVPPPPALSPIEAAVAHGVATGRLGPLAAVPVKPRDKMTNRQLAMLGGGALALLVVAIALVLWFNAEAPAPAPPPPVVQRVYSEAEVQAIASEFAAQLDQLNIPGMKLVTAPQQLSVQGPLDRNAESRFETAVQQLRTSHPGLKVRLELGGDGTSVLPFEVTAAVGGANGSVLLGDGQQLFVGADEQGFKFLGLSGSCLNFLQIATQQKVSQCSDSNLRRR